MKARLTSVLGDVMEVEATTNHPASSYGKAVWVTKDGQAICQVGMEAPFYTVEEIEEEETE